MYLKRLDDVDRGVLRELIDGAVQALRSRHA